MNTLKNGWPGCGRGGTHVWPALQPHPDGFSPSYRQTWDSSCPGKAGEKGKISVTKNGRLIAVISEMIPWLTAEFILKACWFCYSKRNIFVDLCVCVTLQTSSSPLVFSPWLDTLMVSSLLMTPRFTSRMNGHSWVQERLRLARTPRGRDRALMGGCMRSALPSPHWWSTACSPWWSGFRWPDRWMDRCTSRPRLQAYTQGRGLNKYAYKNKNNRFIHTNKLSSLRNDWYGQMRHTHGHRDG